MFEHIIKINDKGALLKLVNKDTEMSLLGLHLVFEKRSIILNTLYLIALMKILLMHILLVR